jgi:2,4-dienoyl-CoA reductase (NADPH2)
MAKRVPGKEEFFETLRYYGKQLPLAGVDLRLNTEASEETLAGFDAVVLATGVLPRDVKIPLASANKTSGTCKVNVVSYVDVLRNNAHVGKRVAVIGAGGIGFDVSDFLTHVHGEHEGEAPLPGSNPPMGHSGGPPLPQVNQEAVSAFLKDWGIDTDIKTGGVTKRQKSVPGQAPAVREPSAAARKVYLLQRKKGKIGAGLGKTTGWIHRMVSAVRHSTFQFSTAFCLHSCHSTY